MSFPPGTEMFHFPGFASHCWDDPCGPGFPIRKFMDQSSFAAPHDLSQRTTSFIASRRLGIHRMLLRHLITLIINARPPLGGRPHNEERPAFRDLSDAGGGPRASSTARRLPHGSTTPLREHLALEQIFSSR